MAMLELPDGRVLAGSYEDGLYIRGASGWRRLREPEGLPSGRVFFLGVAGDALIVSHSNGVYRLPVAQLTDGAAQPEILMQDISRMPDRTHLRGGNGRGIVHEGHAWFPTLAGVLRIALDLALRIALDPGSRRLSLIYGAVDFLGPARLRYRYRMHGFEEDWVTAERRREAFYTNLPTGEYRFEVQAQRQHEPWGPVFALPVSVPPTLSERWPFRLAPAFAVALAGAMLLRWREMRDGDYLLRWGAEEFVVITNESLRSTLCPIVERLRLAVEASGGAPGEPERVTVSIGYAAYPLGGQALDEHDWLSAMNLADQALFEAKAAGRNRIATVEISEAARAGLPEHLSAAQLAELYASGGARLLVGC